MKNNSVTVSAPGKLMLMGEHAVVYGRPCLVTAIDQRLTVTIGSSEGLGDAIDAPGVSDTRFVSRALEVVGSHWKMRLPPLTVRTSSDFSSQYGFGSSSAATAATVYALAEFLGKKSSMQEIFELSYKTVTDVQGIGSGFDVAAAVFGGTLYFVTGGKVIEPLPVQPIPLVVGYTGVKADTTSVVEDVARKKRASPQKVDRIFDAIAKLADEAKSRLGEGDWARVGKLMDFNQEYLRDLGVSTEKLESLILAAKQAGALGAKLSGAGGGDCMIALHLDGAQGKFAVENAIREAGGVVISVVCGAPGVRRETE